MPRVAPSILVKIIDMFFPTASESTPTSAQIITLDHSMRSRLGGVMHVFEQIPSELLATAEPDEYVRMMCAAGELREAIVTGRTYTTVPGTSAGLPALKPTELYGNYNALSQLRRSLALCRDQASPEGSALLKYVTPLETRRSLLADVASAERSLNNSDWKAVTVVAGSVMEALILWALQQKP